MQLERVSLKNGVVGTAVMPKAPWRGSMVLVHGWKSDRTGYITRAQHFAKQGWGCIAIDLRGHGESEGDRSALVPMDNVSDVLSAFDEIIRREVGQKGYVGKTETCLLGVSYGAAQVVLATEHITVDRLVLRAPALYRNEDLTTLTEDKRDDPGFKAFRKTTVKPEDNHILGLASQFKGRLLLVSSGQDESIPRAIINNYAYAFSMGDGEDGRLTYKMIEGAPHSLKEPAHQAEFLSIVSEFLAA